MRVAPSPSKNASRRTLSGRDLRACAARPLNSVNPQVWASAEVQSGIPLQAGNPVEWLKKPSETAVARPLALVDLASTSGFLAGTEASLLGVFLVAVPDLDFHRLLLLRLMVRGTSG